MIQRFENKAKGKEGYQDVVDNLNSLKDKYVTQYQKHLKNATAIRENVWKAENALMKAMGLGEFKDPSKKGTLADTVKGVRESVKRGRAASKMYNRLAEKAPGVTYKDKDITIGQAVGIYMNKEKMPHHKGLDQLFKLNPELKAFADNLADAAPKGAPKFTIDPSGSYQFNTVQFINKDLLKSDLGDFLSEKKKFQKKYSNKMAEDISPAYRDALDNSLDRMGGTTGRGSDFESSQFHQWLQGSVGTIMFLNVRSAALQTLSIANYMSPTNIGSFGKDFMAAGKKGTPQYKVYEKLWNSAYLKERRARAGFDVNAEEIANRFSGRQGKFAKATEWALNKGFVLTSLADGFAIARGGAAYVHGLMNTVNTETGKPHTFDEAQAKWIEQSEEAQQSARPDRVSKHQKAAVSKFILAFANTPAQYFRLSQKAFRTLKSEGNGNVMKGLQTKKGRKEARRILYYVAAQNAIFTALQTLSPALFTAPFTDDEDEDKEALNAYNSMMDTVLRGMGLYGAVVSAVKNVGYNLYKEKDKANPNYGIAAVKGGVGLAPPLSRKVNDLLQVGNAYKYDKGHKGFRSAHAQAIGKGAALANIPLDWFQKKAAAFQYLIDEGLDAQNAIDMLEMIYGNPEFIATKNKNSDDLDLDFDLDLDDIDLDDVDLDL